MNFHKDSTLVYIGLEGKGRSETQKAFQGKKWQILTIPGKPDTKWRTLATPVSA